MAVEVSVADAGAGAMAGALVSNLGSLLLHATARAIDSKNEVRRRGTRELRPGCMCMPVGWTRVANFPCASGTLHLGPELARIVQLSLAPLSRELAGFDLGEARKRSHLRRSRNGLVLFHQ